MIKTIAALIKYLLTKPMTVRFPHEAIEIPEGYRGEHALDIDSCIGCGLCAGICPNKAIELVELPAEYKEKYVYTYPRIDLRKCCFCALCQDICPVDAIRMTKNVFLATPNPSAIIINPRPKEKETE